MAGAASNDSHQIGSIESPRASACDGSEALRQAHYNATVVDMERVHPELAIIRVRPDFGPLRFTPGQYTTLGLGTWEPQCFDGASAASSSPHKLIQRAYSISCGLIDNLGRLTPATGSPVLEFYIALVHPAREPPALTPRLFALSPGDRLCCGRHAHGHYTLDGVRPDDTVIFAATGTGEAPHNAMLCELLARGHRGRIVNVCCVRYRRDLAYLDKHQRLERSFPGYRYVPLTTREPENVDAAVTGYVGKRHLQDYFGSGDFERDTNCRLEPQSSHVFLCGSPGMIGAPHAAGNATVRPVAPQGMIALLEGRGFRIDWPHQAGNIHFEKYW